MSKILEFRNISVHGKHKLRLDRLDFAIQSGERIALVGKSGSGKTTLISTANGLLKPLEGEVLWRGININKLSTRQRRYIGTLWQDLRLIDELNVCQNVNIGALGYKSAFWAIRNLIGLIDYDKCKLYVTAVGLSEQYMASNISELSGGQKQRVALARLMRQKSELILADEPFSNLDPRLTQQMLELLLQAHKKSVVGIKEPSAVLISIHRPDLTHLFDRVIGLDDGRIVLDKKVRDIDHDEISNIYFGN